jgi:hypothetical protein
LQVEQSLVNARVGVHDKLGYRPGRVEGRGGLEGNTNLLAGRVIGPKKNYDQKQISSTKVRSYHGEMAFSFIHAADLHLGSPLVGIAARDPELAARLATASREAFTALVDQAIARHVSFLIVAGDIYDGEWKDTSIGLFFNRQVSRLIRAGILVYTLRGNHDAVSVVTQSVRLPEGVFEFPWKSADTVLLDDLKVAIHGRRVVQYWCSAHVLQWPPRSRSLCSLFIGGFGEQGLSILGTRAYP